MIPYRNSDKLPEEGEYVAACPYCMRDGTRTSLDAQPRGIGEELWVRCSVHGRMRWKDIQHGLDQPDRADHP